MTDSELCSYALKATEFSYVPYSNFHVGAALLCSDGEVITGCNVENASFGLTICAERNAIFKAVSTGKRDFIKIAVTATLDGEIQLALPCGACRQVMAEFCSDDFEILMLTADGIDKYKLEELLPHSFRLKND